MKLGTLIRMTDGREGTVVFNGLIGVGLKWGHHDPDPEDFKDTHGDLFDTGQDDDWEWEPDALLREPWDGCERTGWALEQFVGEDYEVIG